jgi:hypothetical protein
MEGSGSAQITDTIGPKLVAVHSTGSYYRYKRYLCRVIITSEFLVMQYSCNTVQGPLKYKKKYYVSALGKYQEYHFRPRKLSIAELGSDRIRIILPDMTSLT